ncbi:GNAT family N-acetyltransferase [Peteryoungia desertarenae]|uniref:GNAT family N-acetyltransferase n=2 Tax=Peteryoungia desertarenae TaxID=1813451 RepID=A0ABX6QSM9_9HYPH|nr:GNAT family N-acetyltransferase [Peteryoungia desertarenae]
MDGVVDPPSSARSLTIDSLRAKTEGEIALMARDETGILGCAFLRPEATSLYIGKLAILPAAQGRGIGWGLLREAEVVARQLGLPALRLETRIELTDNQQRFARWGFVKTAENRHAGFDRTTSIEMQKLLL